MVKQSRIRDFWPSYQRRMAMIVILMQIIVTIVVGLSLIMAGFNPATLEFVATMVAVLAMTIGANLLLVFSIVALPLKDLTAALTHVSGEPNQVRPPNPNARQYERDGFKPLLQLVYQLATVDTLPQASYSPGNNSELVDAALAHSKASVIILDQNSKVVYASKNAPVRNGRDNQKELTLIFEDEIDLNFWLKDSVKRLVRSEQTWLRVADKVLGEPDRRIYDISANYEKGNAAEVVLVLFDRTELYQPEDEQLDFISFAAHELRGPITVIRGYLDVLGDEMADENSNPAELQALLGRLTVSANRLSGYINNILNASRFDRRHMKVNLSEQRIVDIYDSVRDDMDLRASTQNRLLSVDISPDLPTIAADLSSLSEVFSNLVDNAIKYSNEGGAVEVKAEAERDMVKVTVSDHGIGMPASVVGNLFHKFYRSHRSRETVAGTGIGLYICKAIVESHGGNIEVRSEEGKGSVFSFSIPTYSSVAKNLKKHHNSNEGIIRSGSDGWIKNHAKFRG